MNFNFIKVCAATPKLVVADCNYNTEQIIACINEANQAETELIVFPELSITGYTCGDLFYQQVLIEGALSNLAKIVAHSKRTSMMICVGLPLKLNNQLFNCAVMIKEGSVLGVVPKTYLPNYNEYYEKRWFSGSSQALSSTITICDQEVPFSSKMIFKASNHGYFSLAIEICEDALGPIPLSAYHSLAGANIILNLAASSETARSKSKRLSVLKGLSMSTLSGYVYASAGTGESTTDLVYPGHSLIYENGVLLGESKRFQKCNNLVYTLIDTELIALERQKNTLFNASHDENLILKSYINVPFTHTNRAYVFDRTVDASPFVPSKGEARNEHCLNIFTLQTVALAKRIEHVGTKTVVIGISGGLDSTLALIVCVKAFNRLGLDPAGIIGVTMPGFGTTDRTYNNAISLMQHLGITTREISIVDATMQHFKDIGHDPDLHDITYENSQARERTQLLMDIANQVNGLVIGTGDLSELALGWATYNGDHMSMYGVNAGIPKTLVKFLIEWAAHNEFEGNTRDTLLDIFTTPVSPELLPPSEDGEIEQKTEEIVGPYELHDFYLYYMLSYGFKPQKIAILAQSAFEGQYDYNTIIKWMKVFYRRFFTQQFKRSCLPDGPKVESISLSPRGDWKMPSDASYNMWIMEVESL
ncbi:MAG TPA: NAD(+) synthase [Epulopiscium sp.]|nr:NAD(+) synthase [Candidatus Epulonipiscium sp.]